MAGDRRVEKARKEFEASRSTVLLSAVCIWETAIKTGLGKLRTPKDFLPRAEAFGFERLPVTDVHAWAVRELPHHHRDPFDRLLIAQARVEGATIVSGDDVFDAYGVARLHAG